MDLGIIEHDKGIRIAHLFCVQSKCIVSVTRTYSCDIYSLRGLKLAQTSVDDFDGYYIKFHHGIDGHYTNADSHGFMFANVTQTDTPTIEPSVMPTISPVSDSMCINIHSYAQCFGEIVSVSDTQSVSFENAMDPFIASVCAPNVMDLTTAMPTVLPTLSPIANDACNQQFLDIIFLIDNSCVMVGDECEMRQNGISELLASIKTDTEPRVAYIQFGDFMQSIVGLDHAFYNNLLLNQSVIRDYVREIESLECDRIANNKETDLENAVSTALAMFASVSDSQGRHKKIVLFNNCNSEQERFIKDACDLSRIAHGERVDSARRPVNCSNG